MNNGYPSSSTRLPHRPPLGSQSPMAILTAVLIALGSSEIQGAVFRVQSNQTNNPPDGLTWATAFPKVQQALNAATNGDSVWVAAGTYFESLTLGNGIALYGGFVGSEALLDQRDWHTNLSILDAGRSNRVITVSAGATNTTRLDGLVIRNGVAQFGAGIYCSSSSPTIVNNRILWNTATSYGGGIYSTSGSPLIASNLIQGNVTEGSLASGGGIACRLGGSPRILNNRIIANSSDINGSIAAAGILFLSVDDPQIIGNFISGNRASSVLTFSGASSVAVINNTITWNGRRAILVGAPTMIANNILAYNDQGIQGAEGLDVRNNCFFGNGLDVTGFTNPVGSNGNISVDPALLASFYRQESHLAAGSACVDAGDSSVTNTMLDFDGGPRISGAAVDIGADEFDPGYTVPPPERLHVSTTGNDAADGSAWDKAKRTVQAAVDQVTLSGGEVWVAAGSYTNPLALRPFAFLYGGFLGVETNLSERNWSSNPTILDGGGVRSVVTATNVQHWGAVDGFIIRNGLSASGAGLYCSWSSPTIANNVITNNYATGTSSAGGGIALLSSSPTVINNSICFNTASAGGGIACNGFESAPLVIQNRFEHNSARGESLIINAGGGGLFATVRAQPIVQGNYFGSNTATNTSGGVFSGTGGAICLDGDTMALVINNTLLTNTATSTQVGNPEKGGGIYSRSSAALIANNVVAFGSSGIQAVKIASDTNFSKVQHNCVYGNTTNYLQMPDLTGTNGNISVDPLLMPGGFHLTSDSPCINSGTTIIPLADADFDGNPRVVAGAVDIGVHEFQMPTSIISYAWLQQYGLPTDGSVDGLDGDGDKATTWQEWKAWTIPTDALSVLKMLHPILTTNGTEVGWQSVVGRSYSLERASGNASDFTLLQSGIAGQAGTTTFTDTTATNGDAFLFRVGVSD